jgi:penicillin amidase
VASRPIRHWLARIGLGLLTLALLLGGAALWLARASLPQVAGTIVVAGLERPIRIVRDADAIPHVTAATLVDAYLAMGFLHGQDRLWQMEFNRLVGQGRLAEVLGEAALPADRFLRTLGLAGQAEATLRQLPPATLALLEAYAAGVNAAISGYGLALPPEFLLLRHRPQPWRPVDCLVFQKLMALDLSTNWREELLRARLPPGSPVTLAALAGLPLDRLAAALPEPPPPGIGSNVWVADGSRTRSGLPLLANDPHLQLQAPGQWYLAHLEAPGLAVIGATLPGLPFIVLGHNRDIAWGFTNTGSDTQDLFVERLDPADPGRYLTPDGSAPFEVRTETIAVRDAAPATLQVRLTGHGPVVSDLVPAAADLAGSDRVLALAWTQLGRADSTLDAGFALSRAHDWPSFVTAAEAYQGAQQNMAFADRQGTIGMISPGLVPIRRDGDGRLPVPGWTGAYDWVGTVPAADLPRQVKPAAGVLINANNRLVGDDYPYFLTSDWDPPLRARRIEALLGTSSDLTADRFTEIQLDIVSPLAVEFLPYLLASDDARRERPEQLAALAAWNRRMDADRPEPLLFAAWYRELAQAIYADELGPLFPAYRGVRSDFLRRVLERSQGWCDDIGTPAVETCPQQEALAFERAVAGLEAVRGPDWRRWRWGDAHPAVMAHRPFEQSEALRHWFSLVVPVGGDSSTINVAHPGVTRDGLSFGVVHGPSYRAVYDLADLDRSQWIAATGQSGHPLSPHYGDLTEAWREGRYLPMTMQPAEYQAGAMGVLELVPALQVDGRQ